MSEKKLTANYVESLVSKLDEKWIDFKIDDDNTFKIKMYPEFSEVMYIVNRTASTIISLNEKGLRNEVKDIIFYSIMLDAISNFPVPKLSADDQEIYDHSKLSHWLCRIGFEEQMLSKGVLFNSMIKNMQKLIDEKIEFEKNKIIHNSDIFKNLFSYFQSIPNIIEKFSSSIDGIDGHDVKSLISAFTTLSKDGNMNNLAQNIVTSYLDKKVNNDEIDQSILDGTEKEFENVIDFSEENNSQLGRN